MQFLAKGLKNKLAFSGAGALPVRNPESATAASLASMRIMPTHVRPIKCFTKQRIKESLVKLIYGSKSVSRQDVLIKTQTHYFQVG